MNKKLIIQIVLFAVIIVLGYILYKSIAEPISFQREHEARRKVVIEKLKDIRTLQVAYKTAKGYFTPSFDTLIHFYSSESIRVIKQVGSMDDSLAVAQGLVKRDTITIPVKDTIFNNRPDFDIKKIGIVPYADVPFKLDTAMFMTPSKIQVPLFEASVRNEVYLIGLDQQQIINLNDKEEKKQKGLGFPGLKVGDVHQPNNNAGNWE